MNCVCSNLTCTKLSFCDKQLQELTLVSLQTQNTKWTIKNVFKWPKRCRLNVGQHPQLSKSQELGPFLPDAARPALFALWISSRYQRGKRQSEMVHKEQWTTVLQGSDYTPEHRLSKRFIFSMAQLSSGTAFSGQVLPSKVHNKQNI